MEQVELERRLAQSPLLAGVSLPAEQARVQSFPAGHILSDRPGGVPLSLIHILHPIMQAKL